MIDILLHYTDYIIACAAWVFTLTRLRKIASLESLRHPAFRAWVSALFFSISVTLQVDDFYFMIGHNLAWIASYVTMALAIYFAAVAILSKLRSRHETRLLRVYLILTLTALGELYLANISLSPNHPEHDIPQSAWELLFMLLMYLYAAILGSVSLIAILKHLPQERVRTARVRAVFLCFGTILPILFFLYKISLAFRSFFFPLLDYSAETQITRALMLVSGLLWMTAFLPKTSYVWIVRLFAYAEKLAYYPRAQKMALCLEEECQQKSLQPPSKIPGPGWWELVRNPDQQLYKVAVAILDRRTLLGYPVTTPDRNDPLSTIRSIEEGNKTYTYIKFNSRAKSKEKKVKGKSMKTKPLAIGAVLLMALILSLVPGSPVKDYFVSVSPVKQINATSTITPSGSSNERQRVHATSATGAIEESTATTDDNGDKANFEETQPAAANFSNTINIPTPPPPPIRQSSPTIAHPSPTPPPPPNRTSTPTAIYPTATAPIPPMPTPPAPPIGTP